MSRPIRKIDPLSFRALRVLELPSPHTNLDVSEAAFRSVEKYIAIYRRAGRSPEDAQSMFVDLIPNPQTTWVGAAVEIYLVFMMLHENFELYVCSGES